MKNVYLILLSIILFAFSCQNSYDVRSNEFKIINSGYLNLFDSINVSLDSFSYASHNNISFRDSTLIILNEGSNTISFINTKTSKNNLLDLSSSSIRIEDGVFNNFWSLSKDSFLIYMSNERSLFLLNRDNVVLDSFKFSLKDNNSYIKTSISNLQSATIYSGNVYLIGYGIADKITKSSNNSFVVNKISSKKRVQNLVQYPEDYFEKDLGFLFYRMVYSEVVNDSFLLISYPGSDYISILNMNNENIQLKKLYPEINSLISDFKSFKPVVKGLRKREKAIHHFFSQYSFQKMIYDKYKNIYYRVLLLPPSIDELKSNRFGVREKIILVYNSNFDYLGYSLLSKSYSNTNLFVTEDGLIIQYLKNLKDENNITFHVFRPDYN